MLKSKPVVPPVHPYAFALNGEKMDTTVTFEQAIGLAHCAKYHRRDKGVHKDTDIYAVTNWPMTLNLQVLSVAKVVYAIMHALTHSNNDNELWRKEQIISAAERGIKLKLITDYTAAVLTNYANNL